MRSLRNQTKQCATRAKNRAWWKISHDFLEIFGNFLKRGGSSSVLPSPFFVNAFKSTKPKQRAFWNNELLIVLFQKTDSPGSKNSFDALQH